jgi:PAS domain-containing protein
VALRALANVHVRTDGAFDGTNPSASQPREAPSQTTRRELRLQRRRGTG